MFILFGTKTRLKTLSTGQFYCPQCRTRREYELRLARDYFTLYFIPLVPIHTRGEVVTCLSCGTNVNCKGTQPTVIARVRCTRSNRCPVESKIASPQSGPASGSQ